MRKVILGLLKKEEEIYHINQFSDLDKLDQHKALYILNNGTNVRDIARKIIEKGDSVILAGIYRDACLISIKGVADRIGASTIIHKHGSLSSDDFLG